MEKLVDKHLLRLAWQKGQIPADGLATADGSRVKVISAGEFDSTSECFIHAVVKIDGATFIGSVDVTDGKSRNTDVVLRVTTDKDPILCRENGDVVPQVILSVSDNYVQKYGELIRGMSDCCCGERMAAMGDYQQLEIKTRLVTDRLQRKNEELLAIHRDGMDNWNHTLYVMTFRAMAGPKNKEAFTKLALALPYSAVMHERDSVVSLEAMLLGTAGLIFGYEDDYMLRLQEEFKYFQRKYNISPLRFAEWHKGGITPAGNPVIRLAQLASFFSQKDFLFSNVIQCASEEDIYKLFHTSASEYWLTHYVPESKSSSRLKSLGRDKALSLGINLVVPIQFAYGSSIRDEGMKARAMDLLERINAENNTITRKWKNKGVRIEYASDSQSILELNNEFCKQAACAYCPIGKRVITNCNLSGK